MTRTAGVPPALAKVAGETPAVVDDLDALVSRVDPDRWLSSRFIADAERRADVVALYAFDYELARAGKVASNPLIAEIRLTWWREALDEIYGGRIVRGHPTARALEQAVARRALPRGPLEAMIEARIDAFYPETALDASVRAGGSTAVAAAMVIGDPQRAEAARLAGEAWGGSVDPLPLARGESLPPWGKMKERRGKRESHLPHQGEVTRVSERKGVSALDAASREARRLEPSAFPAVAHVTLLRGRKVSPLGARLRLMRATLTGRL